MDSELREDLNGFFLTYCSMGARNCKWFTVSSSRLMFSFSSTFTFPRTLLLPRTDTSPHHVLCPQTHPNVLAKCDLATSRIRSQSCHIRVHTWTRVQSPPTVCLWSQKTVRLVNKHPNKWKESSVHGETLAGMGRTTDSTQWLREAIHSYSHQRCNETS